MKVLVATHPVALDHDTGDWHPESPSRIGAVLAGLEKSGVPLGHIESPEIERSQLALVHDPRHIDTVEALCRSGGGMIDADTVVSFQSFEAALRSAGALGSLAEELESSSDAVGFAVTRPPGHHATSDQAMGFCLFNNVAVATAILRKRGLRVAILDWDVHHGNGTQSIVGDDAGVLFASVHQSNFYPYEGEIADIERGAPGTNINIPVPAGTAGDVIREIWGDLVLPTVRKFDPDWILVSCGFDAHVRDPIGQLRLTEADYGWIASGIAATASGRPVLFALEGGYDMAALEGSAAATVRGITGHEPTEPPMKSDNGAGSVLKIAGEAIKRHWG